MGQHKPVLTYQDSGVSIDRGAALVDRITPLVRQTARPGVLQGLGGFGGLFELPADRYRHPVLVSGTDGVGTKLKLAARLDRHHTIGIDLVAMCVNDIVVCGAEPLYFLDYFASGKLDIDQAESVVQGIVTGCVSAGCALIGGETAEMPGMYRAGDYDLAGFAVGIVEKEQLILPDRVQPGDVLIGLASSGPHSNGYSLIRKILEHTGTDLGSPFDDSTLGNKLMAPTRIYVSSILKLLESVPVHAISHITGGGLPENLPRVLPKGVCARISTSAIPFLPIFRWLQEQGNVAEPEMYRTFNCGIGMVVCVGPAEAETTRTILESGGEQTHVLGEIVDRGDSAVMFAP